MLGLGWYAANNRIALTETAEIDMQKGLHTGAERRLSEKGEIDETFCYGSLMK